MLKVLHGVEYSVVEFINGKQLLLNAQKASTDVGSFDLLNALLDLSICYVCTDSQKVQNGCPETTISCMKWLMAAKDFLAARA